MTDADRRLLIAQIAATAAEVALLEAVLKDLVRLAHGRPLGQGNGEVH